VRQALTDAQGSPKHPSTITQEGEPDAEKAMLKPLAALSKLVLEPLAEHIDGKKRWYISPDASLWLVPWAALPLKDGRYAVEAHTISYLVSGRDLAAGRGSECYERTGWQGGGAGPVATQLVPLPWPLEG